MMGTYNTLVLFLVMTISTISSASPCGNTIGDRCGGSEPVQSPNIMYDCCGVGLECVGDGYYQECKMQICNSTSGKPFTCNNPTQEGVGEDSCKCSYGQECNTNADDHQCIDVEQGMCRNLKYEQCNSKYPKWLQSHDVNCCKDEGFACRWLTSDYAQCIECDENTMIQPGQECLEGSTCCTAGHVCTSSSEIKGKSFCEATCTGVADIFEECDQYSIFNKENDCCAEGLKCTPHGFDAAQQRQISKCERICPEIEFCINATNSERCECDQCIDNMVPYFNTITGNGTCVATEVTTGGVEWYIILAAVLGGKGKFDEMSQENITKFLQKEKLDNGEILLESDNEYLNRVEAPIPDVNKELKKDLYDEVAYDKKGGYAAAALEVGNDVKYMSQSNFVNLNQNSDESFEKTNRDDYITPTTGVVNGNVVYMDITPSLGKNPSTTNDANEYTAVTNLSHSGSDGDISTLNQDNMAGFNSSKNLKLKYISQNNEELSSSRDNIIVVENDLVDEDEEDVC
eukprot:Pgem_evm1s18134